MGEIQVKQLRQFLPIEILGILLLVVIKVGYNLIDIT